MADEGVRRNRYPAMWALFLFYLLFYSLHKISILILSNKSISKHYIFKLLWPQIWTFFFLTGWSVLFLFTNWHCWCYFHRESKTTFVIFNYLNVVSHILHDSPHQTHLVMYHPNISATISLKVLLWEKWKTRSTSLTLQAAEWVCTYLTETYIYSLK